ARLAGGEFSNDAKDARRTHVNINKYWTSIQCTRVIRDAIEVLGGNGTIEEFSVLPRLYRDAIVLESWEGTHNTLCAQVLRDFATRDLHRPWLAEIHEALSTSTHPSLEAQRLLVTRLLNEVTARIERLLFSADADYAALHIRVVVDRMCILNSYLSLLLELEWELVQPSLSGKESGKGAMLELFQRLCVDPVDAMDDVAMPGLIRKVSTID
ncbi:MAG: hypothetical protein GXP11_06635, partial [Gammaproteobacteria bacterium]|nr:hypothetical protein [Gammaproteobacteria bacterium]